MGFGVSEWRKAKTRTKSGMYAFWFNAWGIVLPEEVGDQILADHERAKWHDCEHTEAEGHDPYCTAMLLDRVEAAEAEVRQWRIAFVEWIDEGYDIEEVVTKMRECIDGEEKMFGQLEAELRKGKL